MAQTYQFNVGAITCTVLSDGTSPLEMERLTKLFRASEEEIAEEYAAIGLTVDEVQNNINCLMLQTGDDTILVDTGMGIAHESMGQIFEGMAEHGIQPDDITKVIITHAHGDHVNGLLDADGELQFPNATLLFNLVEWNYWYAQGKARGPAKELLEKIKPQKQGFFVNEEIVPGIMPLAAYGHTLGHTALLIQSEGEQMMHLVDTLHRLFQFSRPDWSISFDTQKTLAERTRADMLERAAEDGVLTMFYHLPFPGLGHVVEHEGAYRWEPIEL